MVDSADRERVQEARQELWRILRDREMRACPLLVFANKQDVRGAMGEAELAEALGLGALDAGADRRAWRLQATCAVDGKGLWDGLAWLVRTVRQQRRARAPAE